MSPAAKLTNFATLGGATERPAELARARPGALPGEQLQDVPPDRLRPSPAQVRSAFPPADWTPAPDDDSPDAAAARALEELVASVREHGVLEPVLARDTAAGLELLAGHRRVEAAIRAGRATVPVRVLAPATDADAAAITATENLAREDLSPWETVRALAALRHAFRAAGRDASGAAVARAAGRSEGQVSEAIRLAELVMPGGTPGVPETDLQRLKGATWADLRAVLAHAKMGADAAAAVALRWRPPRRAITDPAPAPDPAAPGRGSLATAATPVGGTWTLRFTAASADGPALALRGPAGGRWRAADALTPDEARAVLPELERLVKDLRRRSR